MEKKSNPPSSRPKADPDFDPRRLSSVAFEVVIFNVIVVWGGYKLDEFLLNKVPWMIILAVLLSVSGTIFYLFKKLNP